MTEKDGRHVAICTHIACLFCVCAAKPLAFAAAKSFSQSGPQSEQHLEYFKHKDRRNLRVCMCIFVYVCCLGHLLA